MKMTVWMFLLLSTVLLTGCAPSVIVNGVRYQALTPKEERTMIEMARQSLLHQPKKFSAEELRLIRTADPVFSVRYNGDRSGKASSVWQCQKRTITFFYTGPFLVNGKMGMYMQITDREPEILNLAKEQQAKEAAKRRAAPRKR